MNISKFEAALGCKNITENADEMKTDVPPTNNKNNAELFDDSMVCNENWNVNDGDGNQKGISTSQINNKQPHEKTPPKSDAVGSEVLSTCASPKSKKRKLSSFDDLIQNIINDLDYSILYTNFTKLLFFLESDHKECAFPFVTKEYEEFFEMIIQDVNILRSKSLNADFRYICDKIMCAAAGNTLYYVFENRPGLSIFSKIMVIKKVPKMDQSENSTASASRITATKIPPSHRATELDPIMKSRSLLPAISLGFQIHCLRTLLAFIKNHAINAKEFPELNAEQAKFMHLLLGRVAVSDFDGNSEIKELYKALVDAVKKYRLQFEFKIKCVETSGGKKSVIFEKVPKPFETTVDSNETAFVSIIGTMNTNIDVPNTEASKSQTPKTDDTMPEVAKTEASQITDSKSDVPKAQTLMEPFLKLQASTGAIPKIRKVEAPKAPKSKASKTDTSKSKAPKIDASKSQVPGTGKLDVPKTWALKTEGPNSWCLKTDALKLGIKKIDFVKSQAPKTDGLKSVAPKSPASKTDGSKSPVLKTDSPKWVVPKTDSPKSGATKTDSPITGVTKIDSPKWEVPNTDSPKYVVPKTDSPKSGATKTDSPITGVTKIDSPESGATKTDEPQSGSTKIDEPKSGSTKIDEPKSGSTKIDEPKSGAINTDTPKLPAPNTEPAQPSISKNFKKPKRTSTERLAKIAQLKHESELNLIKDTPPKLISDTLDAILDFLQDTNMDKILKFVPNTALELSFYRKSMKWLRSGMNLSRFGEEFREIHCRISHLMCRIKVQDTGKGANPINEKTGVREISFKKSLKDKTHTANSTDKTLAEESDRTLRKPKVNVQKALQLAATNEIKLGSVIDLYKSLRSKKKDKKRWKAEYMTANFRRASQEDSSSSASGSAATSRASSSDRAGARARQTSKRSFSEIGQTSSQKNRTAQLIEALNQPVQSEKARKMMLGMGWSGGALGTRGGITEPIMPNLHLVSIYHQPPVLIPFYVGPTLFTFVGHTSRFYVLADESNRAGLGRPLQRASIQSSNRVTVPNKPDEPKPKFMPPCGADYVTKYTENINRDDNTLDSGSKDSEFNYVEVPKSSKCEDELQKSDVKPKYELPEPSTSEIGFPGPSTSKIQQSKRPVIKTEIAKQWICQPEPPKGVKISPEFKKPESVDRNNRQPVANAEPPVEEINRGVPKPEMTGNFRLPFRLEILHNVFYLLVSDPASKTLTYGEPLTKKQRKFVNLSLAALRSQQPTYTFAAQELHLCKRIRQKYAEGKFVVAVTYSPDFTSLNLMKIPTIENNGPLAPIENASEVKNITEEDLVSYIWSKNGNENAPKKIETQKFKVLFLLNILNFIKSPSEEVEVTFNKVLNGYQKGYVENVVDEVNMRIKFGSSPAEIHLGNQIRENIKDAFLSVMFNHKFTVATVTKNYRFKPLNRTDNAVKRKSKTTVNLDDFTSAPTERQLNASKLQNEPFDEDFKNENPDDYSQMTKTETRSTAEFETPNLSDEESLVSLPTRSELGAYDSDCSSVEEYNKDNANAKVPELPPGEEGVNVSNFLYLYEKEKTNTAGIENNCINNNNSASKVSDIKNNYGNGNVDIDNNDNQFIDMKRYEGSTKNNDKGSGIPDSETAGYVDFMQAIDKNKVLNTQVFNENKFLVSENYEFDSDVTEDIERDEIKHIKSPYLQEDVVMTDIYLDLNKVMEKAKSKTPNIQDKPMAKKPRKSMEIINQLKLMSALKSDETVEITNQAEPTGVINTIESSKDVNNAQTNKTSINPSDVQIVKDNLDIKTVHCDRSKEEDVVLSKEKICDTPSEKSSHEETAGTDVLEDSEIKHARIEHTDHPNTKLTADDVVKIQQHIANCIWVATELPLLKCHGVQNGVLFYTCHSKKTFDWLQKTIHEPGYGKVFDTKEVTKMALKIKCSYYCHSSYLFNMIEMYNKGISTKDWYVEKYEKNHDSIYFIVKMDKFSIKFIQKMDYALYVGIDKAEFVHIWD